MLGISVYFQDLDYDYLRECANIGVKYIFTSLHIPEEDYSDLDEKLPVFLSMCQTLGLQIVPDVSPVTFEKLNIKYGDFHQLKEMGFKAIRLDYGFDDVKDIVTLSKDFKIMLNASIISEKILMELLSHGVLLQDLTLTHNFYPKTFTGLTEEAFQSQNALFHKYKMPIQAFVCGDKQKRFPLYEGLPTLEKHRDVHPYVAAIELIKKYHIQDIMIGDSQAKSETLQYIKDYMDHHIITIKVHLEKEYQDYYQKILKCRKDHSEYTIRLNTPRVDHLAIHQNSLRRKGTITIDNYLMGRYCGEMQLVMKDLPRDARVNVIGFIHPDYIDVLDYIDENTKIKLVRL